MTGSLPGSLPGSFAAPLPAAYAQHLRRKRWVLVAGIAALIAGLLASLALGAARLPLGTVVHSLLAGPWGEGVPARERLIVWSIRLPQALAALVAGSGLAVAGATMQSVLRNPLASPFTLGITHAAAFGAAFAVMLLGGGSMTSSGVGAVHIGNPYLTTLAALAASLLAAGIIIAIARVRGATPEIMVLTGVALGALCTAGTMFLQYFADDVQLAAMVFWTFGDTARATWSELGLLAGVTVVCSGWFMTRAWSFNALDAGDETAHGLGVRVERERMLGMFLATLLTAVIIAFLGIIGFVGLVVPHMARRVLGPDHRFLLPASLIGGGLLLVVSDTVARLVLAPHVLPVSVLTAFMGAPVFIALILGRGGRRGRAGRAA